MESAPPITKAGGGIAKQARKRLASQIGKSVNLRQNYLALWGCERLGEAFAEEAVGWMGGLWGRWREMESLDFNGLTLYI